MKSKIYTELFAKNGKLIRYHKGQIIVRPEDTPQGVYFVSKGNIRIYNMHEDGSENLIIIYNKGSIFPIFWAILNIHKDRYYEAMDEVELYRVEADKFIEYIKSNTEITYGLVEKVTQMLNHSTDRLSNFGIAKAYPRLVMGLLIFADKFGRKTGKKIIIDIPISHKDIASYLSISRETASRGLSLLTKKKIIGNSKGMIIVNNIDLLNKELTSENNLH